MSDAATGLDKLNQTRVQTVLNLLLESPFFYREDDPEHFQYLRANRAAFTDFLQRYFGWRLFIDRNLARILKDRLVNPALKPGQRLQFQVSTRNESIVFLLLLQYYEHELVAQNLCAGDGDQNLRFRLGAFLEWSRHHLGEILGGQAPDDRALLDWSRPLLTKLVKFRFLKEVERAETPAAGGLTEILYEVLPGLHCYEPTQLASQIITTALRKPGDGAGEVESAGEVEGDGAGEVE
ncbi:MAG: DUF2398 family protein, partial [Candidatus Riflebacteria bacterium]|nr:DUF2398 family protein [Candidatus Riflebacteria bacterium]